MLKYDYSDLEEDAYKDSIRSKQKPKKQKKSWKENNDYKQKQKFNYRKIDKKGGFSNHPDRIQFICWV